MSEKVYTIEEIRALVAPIAQAYGVERIYLFGSYAGARPRRNQIWTFALTGGEYAVCLNWADCIMPSQMHFISLLIF